MLLLRAFSFHVFVCPERAKKYDETFFSIKLSLLCRFQFQPLSSLIVYRLYKWIVTYLSWKREHSVRSPALFLASVWNLRHTKSPSPWRFFNFYVRTLSLFNILLLNFNGVDGMVVARRKEYGHCGYLVIFD